MRFAAFGGSGYEKPHKGRKWRPLWVFSPPHFLCAKIASQFFYRAQKKRRIQPKRYAK
jgi:hypothetical protein